MTGSKVLLLGIAAASFPSAIYWLVRGFYPRRHGRTPHCRHCDYNLTGFSSDQCPECGTMISLKTIVYGERDSRPVKIMVGLFCSVPTLLVFALWLSAVHWYRLIPTTWVMAECRSGNFRTATRAWAELDRRIVAGTLTPAQKKALAEFAQPITLEVRPRVVEGHMLLYKVNKDPLLVTSSVAQSLLVIGDCVVDGKSCKPKEQPYSYSLGGGVRAGRSFVYRDVGQHTLQIVCQLQILNGATLLYQANFPLTATFEVLPAGTDDIKLIRDPSLNSALYACIRNGPFFLSSRSDMAGHNSTPWVSGEIKLNGPPVNVAFQVFARVDGKEYPAGFVSATKDQSVRQEINWATTDLLTGKTDIILRSNIETARDTMDLFEIWEGELVLENVLVKAVSTRRATSLGRGW